MDNKTDIMKAKAYIKNQYKELEDRLIKEYALRYELDERDKNNDE